MRRFALMMAAAAASTLALPATAQPLDVLSVPGQPLAANVSRVLQALDLLGAPLTAERRAELMPALAAHDGARLQTLLDSSVIFVVTINPESRVKAARGPGQVRLQQAGYRPVLVKVINQSTITKELRIISPQAGQVYAGMTQLSARRLQRQALRETESQTADPSRFLDVVMYSEPPLAAALSGLEVEYAMALIYSRDAGKLEATIGFDVGQGNQDLGFRGEVPVLLEVQPAVPVQLRVEDFDGQPATARFVFRDPAGHVFPPQGKRLAPDLYFQEQIYRRDGETVLLPPGRLTVEYGRGPEYRALQRPLEIAAQSNTGETPAQLLAVKLERWINPAAWGFYSGDHHIHGAGCAHYTSPTEGVTPEDMFRQVEGEGLSVGCVLTWGPCFDYQRRFFSPGIHQLSRPFTIMKYDLEVSGFGSESFGHVCLLNLKDQVYPGSDGTKTKGWPKWTTPVLRWAKAQGAYTGYAHSASGLEIHPQNAARRLLTAWDEDRDGLLAPAESGRGLFPQRFEAMDTDRDGALTEAELVEAHQRAAAELPNLAVPEMNGVGAMEICVTTALGVCDFISAMDTARIAEWNMWYHLLNCGFPLKASGETDFPCMSGERVGQGRVYVHLGRPPQRAPGTGAAAASTFQAAAGGDARPPLERIDFPEWCQAMAKGRSYVSDGFAHAVQFTVNGIRPGWGDVILAHPEKVQVQAKVAFAPETPATVAQGLKIAPGGARWLGDSVNLHGPRTKETARGGTRPIEIVVNGRPVAAKPVPADGQVHALSFEVSIERSSWVALRQFPQLHTNPVNVLVAGGPIRASRASARWCLETIEQLWRERQRLLPETERAEARATFDQAKAQYRRIAAEAGDTD